MLVLETNWLDAEWYDVIINLLNIQGSARIQRLITQMQLGLPQW